MLATGSARETTVQCDTSTERPGQRADPTATNGPTVGLRAVTSIALRRNVWYRGILPRPPGIARRRPSMKTAVAYGVR